MPITLDEPAGTELPPVVRSGEIGQQIIGALVDAPEWRDQLKRNDAGEDVPIPKGNGKNKQELVVTLVTMPGTTKPVGRGDDEWTPEPGDVVRIIVRGKSAGDYIDAKKALGGAHQVGDVFTHQATNAVAYNERGGVLEDGITDQARVVEHKMKGRSVGIYGPLTIRRATPADAQWVTVAETEHHAMKEAITLDDTPAPTPAVAAPEGF